MATEVTSEIIATSSTSPDHELNNTETSGENVSSGPTIVNGTTEKEDSKQDTDHVESNANSAEVSVSGGSDTENSKAEASKSQVDEKGHARTGSTVKKLASFKPVSVNRTFLAAKGAPPAPSKLGDKGSAGSVPAPAGPSLSSTARPRLVAKLGSGLRDSAPRTASSANGGKAGSAPDASAVWNKNRPVPPPEPKRFTDEELKQRYGIHLATRLQSDDPGKQANWADIDDDDDDWAPETIEWTDGTKITLPHADDAPIPSPEPIPAVVVKEEKVVEAPKPKSPPLPQPSASPTVKPSTFGSGRAGLILKGATERPTLVAKPPGPPTPVKSPWAPLPPVEKAPPIAIEIPQPQQQRFAQRDPHGFQGMPPPAKEIAADDFSRTWRDNGNTSRELYNSQSGRYEPVNDARRGSVRSGDARSHQPAVLQRPMNHDGPAEPSAAFQTHRASGHDGGFNRRRTSSNVSGGSGNFARRMSRGHDMPEMLNVRRESLAAVSDSPTSPRNFSPSGQHPNQTNHRGYQNQSWQRSPVVSHPSPQISHAQPMPLTSVPATTVEPPTQEPENSLEDRVLAQKLLMRQTREQAIKRRQEEEAREEEARRERIRIKLEAMGPAPESRKEKKEAPKEEKPIPTHIQARQGSIVADVETKKEEPSLQVAANSTNKAEVEPEVVSKPTPPSLNEEKLDKHSPHEAQANGFQPPPHPVSATQDARSSQTWQGHSSQQGNQNKPWAPIPAQQASTRNVWGPPTSDRTLGNGTFSVPEMQSSTRPGPIGPPSSNRANGQLQQGRGREMFSSRPDPIGPPKRPESAQTAANKALAAKSGWGSLSEKLKQEDSASARQFEQEMARKRELRESGLAPEIVGPVLQEKWHQVGMNDDGSRGHVQGTHKTVLDPTQAQPVQGERPEEATTRATFEEENAYRRNADGAAPQGPQQNDAWRPAPQSQPAPPSVRGSRFFPNNRDVRLEEQPNLFQRPASPSPPPPTMAGHPAYDGDMIHPQIKLPRPPPVVRLPPAPVLAPIGPPKPLSFAAAVQAPVIPLAIHNAGHAPRQDYSSRSANMYQDIRRQEPPAAGGWQEKINSLVGRKSSPPKSHALAVDSASKHALELPTRQVSATVSLPLSDAEEVGAVAGPVESKPAAEECFEEQEMGSLPNVKVPIAAPMAAWNLAPAAKALPKKFVMSHTTSAEPLPFSQQVTNNNGIVTIKVPGQEESKTVNVPIASRQRSNPRSNRGGQRGGARGSSSSNYRGRGRDSSGGFPSPTVDNASTSSGPSSTGRNGRGRGGFGSSWGRSPQASVRT